MAPSMVQLTPRGLLSLACSGQWTLEWMQFDLEEVFWGGISRHSEELVPLSGCLQAEGAHVFLFPRWKMPYIISSAIK